MQATPAFELGGVVCRLHDLVVKLSNEVTEVLGGEGAGELRAAGDLKILAQDLANCVLSLDEHVKTATPSDPSNLTTHEQTILQLSATCQDIANRLLDSVATLSTRWNRQNITTEIQNLGNCKQQILCSIFVILEAHQRLLVAKVEFGFKKVDIYETQNIELRKLIRQIDEEISCSATTSVTSTRVDPSSPSDEIPGNRSSKLNTRNSAFGMDPIIKSMDGLEDAVVGALHFAEIEDMLSNIGLPSTSYYQWIWSSNEPLDKRRYDLGLWLQTGMGCFWIKGRAFCGKSTLMKYLYTHLKDNADLAKWAGDQDPLVCSFFFSRKGTRLQNSMEGLVRTLLLAFLRKNAEYIPLLFPRLCRFWISGQQGKRTGFSFAELRNAFLTMTTAPYLDVQILFLVDGVNEFNGDIREPLALFSAAATSERVKILISSMSNLACAMVFSRLPSLRLEDFISRDITQYVKGILGSNQIMMRLESLNEGAIDGIVQDVVSGAQYMFLWAYLATAILVSDQLKCNEINELHSKLAELPDRPHALCNYLLRLMLAASDMKRRRLLHLLLKSNEIQGKYKPTLLQLRLMITDADPSDSSLAFPDPIVNELESRHMQQKLKTSTGGFVEVVDAPFPQHGLNGSIVRFPHCAIAEFLRKRFSETDLAAATDLDDLAVIKVLLKSSLAEMTTTLWDLDGGDLNSLACRALIRFFTYGNNNEYALYLCQSQYVKFVAQKMLETWRTGGLSSGTPGSWMQNRELFMQFASQYCSAALFRSLQLAIDTRPSTHTCDCGLLEHNVPTTDLTRTSVLPRTNRILPFTWKLSRQRPNISRRERKEAYRVLQRGSLATTEDNEACVPDESPLAGSFLPVGIMLRQPYSIQKNLNAQPSDGDVWEPSEPQGPLQDMHDGGDGANWNQTCIASVKVGTGIAAASRDLQQLWLNKYVNDSCDHSSDCSSSPSLAQEVRLSEHPGEKAEWTQHKTIVSANGDFVKSHLSSVAQTGPCSSTWHIRPWGRRRQPITTKSFQTKTRHEDDSSRCTVLTPSHANDSFEGKPRACLPCQRSKAKCAPNPNNPRGPCLRCLRLDKPAFLNMPCRGYKLLDASLIREQQAPWARWTRRWGSMTITEDITDWKSTSTVNLSITNCAPDTSYELEVCEFIPLPGDQMYQTWMDRGQGKPIEKTLEISPYAITDMRKAATNIRQHIDDSMQDYITRIVGDSDRLFWDTFCAAVKWSKIAPTPVERALVLNCLRLWVVSRMASHPESVCNTDLLCGVVTDPSSPYLNMRPLHPVMNAQLEIIMYSTQLRPLSERILSSLEDLLMHKQPSNWLTVYFAIFILLHNCALTTRRDAEFARRTELPTTFANPISIAEHHVGVLVMLAHFHHDGRGRQLASLMDNLMSVEDFQSVTELPYELACFVKQSAEMIRSREPYIRYLRARGISSNENYFVSQMFEFPWQPPPIKV